MLVEIKLIVHISVPNIYIGHTCGGVQVTSNGSNLRISLTALLQTM